MSLVTASQIVEASHVVSNLDKADAHNVEVIGRRINELATEGQREFWTDALTLTVLGDGPKTRSNALQDLLGRLVEILIEAS